MNEEDCAVPKPSSNTYSEPITYQSNIDITKPSADVIHQNYCLYENEEIYLGWCMSPNYVPITTNEKYFCEDHSNAHFFHESQPNAHFCTIPQPYILGNPEACDLVAFMPPMTSWPYWYQQPNYYGAVSQNNYFHLSYATWPGELEDAHSGLGSSTSTSNLLTIASSSVDSSPYYSDLGTTGKITSCSEYNGLSECLGYGTGRGRVGPFRLFASLSLRMELIINGADVRSSLMVRNIPTK
jgi:hypothetical protein